MNKITFKVCYTDSVHEIELNIREDTTCDELLYNDSLREKMNEYFAKVGVDESTLNTAVFSPTTSSRFTAIQWAKTKNAHIVYTPLDGQGTIATELGKLRISVQDCLVNHNFSEPKQNNPQAPKKKKSIAKTCQDCAELKIRVDQQQADIERLKFDHKNDIDQLKFDHKNDIDQLKFDHKNDIDQLKEDFSKMQKQFSIQNQSFSAIVQRSLMEQYVSFLKHEYAGFWNNSHNDISEFLTQVKSNGEEIDKCLIKTKLIVYTSACEKIHFAQGKTNISIELYKLDEGSTRNDFFAIYRRVFNEDPKFE